MQLSEMHGMGSVNETAEVDFSPGSVQNRRRVACTA